MIKENPVKGAHFRCLVCETWFHRSPAQMNRGLNKTCSKECQSKYFSGEGNPFWGKTHSQEAKNTVSQSRKGKCIGNTNATGYKHTEEAKKKISDASKVLWTEHRDKMIASLPRGEQCRFHKPPEERRYRKQFSPRQRREWTSNACAYCGITDDLVLDHIIPIFDGGTNEIFNAQTLCRRCNLWKLHFIDLPRYQAALAYKGAN